MVICRPLSPPCTHASERRTWRSRFSRCALAISSRFGPLAIIANVAALLVYFGCSVAAWQLRRRNVAAGGIPFRVPGAAVVPFLSCAMIIGLLSSITLPEWRVLGIVLVVASVLFVLTRKRRAAVAPRTA